jgi:penicillin-binding protein 1C
MRRLLAAVRTSSDQLVRRVVVGLVALLALQVAAFVLDAALPPDMARAGLSSPVALDRNGAWLRALPVEDGRWRVRADLDRTDPAFVERLVALEDERFWLHPGVDPVSVVRAGLSDLVAGRVVSGGSTLSMQAARRLEPRARTFGAKLVEAARALQLELRLSKREVLALYLTLAPYGGNLEGVRAASLAWFGHEPSSLTLGEQALLIALPQSPEARRPDRRPQAARIARDDVLSRLQRRRLITALQAEEARAEPIPTARQPFPAVAWQVAGQLARTAPADEASVATTLDAALQTRLETLAAATAQAQGPETSVAVLVVEEKTRAVRAAVASAGRGRPGGWLDMTRALRSPGSALKPFIYAFAFEAGLAAPDTRMRDAPIRFAGYQPENFDRTFHDVVTAREALAFSLNVPAVATLERVGPAAFETRLAAAGVRLVRPRAGAVDPGLALALGGAGISMRDLAVLYGALGDGGVAKPLAWTLDEADRRPSERGVRLTSAEAAGQVLDILRESPPPVGRTPTALIAGGARLAFKTGTSYGFRDAVAAGVGGGYVVTVWTGRPDGGARGGDLTGREAALPLLFDAFDAVQAGGSAARPIAPRSAPRALTDLEQADAGPKLIFPPDGAQVAVEAVGPASRGLALAARGEGLRWYADGAPLALEPGTGRVVWRPPAAGFYRLTVVDSQGRAADAKVRIRTGAAP